MNRLEILAKRELRNRGGKIPTLRRIKIGRGLAFIAALPLFTSWMFLFAIPMMIPVKPSVWTKSKMIQLKEWRRLR